MSTYTLDFSITTDAQRSAFIGNICAQTTYTERQYTQMADYILLGCNQQTGDKNYIYPEVFSSPYATHDKQTDSLDELMEDPTFSETSLHPIQRSIYKKSRRKLNRISPKYSSIPNMKELWNVIDAIKVKTEQEPNNFRLKRLLIQLQQDQYALVEANLPTQHPLPQTSPSKQYFQWENGIPLNNGTIAHLDLTNPEHMSEFLLNLPALTEYCTSQYCDLYTYISEVNQSLIAAPLTNQQRYALHLYHNGYSGKQISTMVNTKFNTNYSQSYISTMLHKQIASKVAFEYAEIHNSLLYANDPTKWRICLSCKQKKLLSTHNFIRHSNKPGGYSLICKECEHKQKEKYARNKK